MRNLHVKTRASQDDYKLKRKEANKLCRNKKKNWLNGKINKMEENHKKNETRKFFEEVKNFKQQQIINPLMCKNAEGNILMQTTEVLNRWKEYFQILFGINKIAEIQIPKMRDVGIQIPPPSYNELCYIINNLKTNKAPGSDNIVPELIKYGGRTLKQELHVLMMKIWNEERLPEQWSEGIICPIFKKGDRLVCGNYRPITLLNITYKIFAILLNQRLTKLIENKLDDYQMGFRVNRSTIDNIFIVRQIFEKCHEYNIDLFNIFIDFRNAFDSVYRNEIIKCLEFYEVPNKLVRLIALTLNNTTAQIKVNNNLSGKFNIQYGVKQGDPLSATLFSLVIDFILKKLEMRGNISTKLSQCIAYADDIIITTRTKSALTETFNNLKEQSMKFGLIINERKTKFLKCNRKSGSLEDLKICSTKLQQVTNIKYLGSMVNSDNSIEMEIKERIILGNKAYYANLALFKSRLISKQAKLRIYWTIIRPVVTYASETWVLKESVKQRLLIFERSILRRIFGPTKMSNGNWRIKNNSELNKLINNRNIINHIKSLRLGWFGHINRMQDQRLAKNIYKWRPIANRRLGRPKNRWEDDVLNDLKLMKVNNWMKLVQNRKEWKKLVEKVKTLTGEL